MRKITIIEHISLDGVIQAPGGPDEDGDGDFDHGGWAAPHSDPAVGAAIDAAVGLKIHPYFKSAVARMTSLARVFEPDPKNRDIYRDLYERVYLKLYERLKPLYEEIREITDYPPKR
jgi:hypothetical protein